MMGTPSLGADEALASTSGKDNYQRLARVIVVGGTSLLREVFDSIHPPNKLFSVLTSPVVRKDLSWINNREHQCLYPSAAKCGSSVDFDITMLYKLLKTICKLPKPTGNWNELPDDSDTSLSADLARIRCYRNSICHDSENMEIPDDKFRSLWASIRDAIVRIAQGLSKGSEWKSAVDKFLTDPLTLEDKRHVEELNQWYLNDMENKKALKELKDETSHIKDDTGQIKGDTSQIKSDASQIKGDTSHIKGDTSQIKSDASHIKGDTSQIKSDASQIKSDASQIKGDTSQIKGDASQIKGDASQIKGDTSQIKGDTSQIKGDTSEIKDDTSLIKDETSQIKDDTSLIKDETSQIKDDTSLIKDETSQIKDDTSLIKDETSQIKDDTSLVKGDTSQIKDVTSLIRDETSQIKDDTSLIKGDTSQIKDDTSLIKGDTSRIKGDTSQISQIKDDTSEIKQLLRAVRMEMRINSKKVRYGTSQQHTDESLDYPSSPPAWLITKILELIEKKYLKTHNPSGPDEENKFQEFMAELGLEIADTFLGSLVITLKISSLQILENLWKVYCSGYLGKKVQSCLATDYVLNKLNLRELQLETTIRREDYEACRRHFTQSLETPVKTEEKEISEEVQETAKTPVKTEEKEISEEVQETAETPVKTEEKEISEKVQETVDFSCRCDEKKLDLIVLVEQTATLRFFNKLKAGFIHFVELINMQDYDFRMALVSYQVNGFARLIETFTRDVEKMKSSIRHLKRHHSSSEESRCGLAHGLQLAVNLSDNVEFDDDSKCRKDANKICILLPNIYGKQLNPKDYSCEHGYDVIQLCRQLLVGGVSLTTLAIQKPLEYFSYRPTSDWNLMEEFFQGISLKTGGQLLKAKDVRQLSQIVIYAVKEQISLERLMGTVSELGSEIRSGGGSELSHEKVVEELTVQLRARSCRRDVIDVKDLATAPQSELAKKLAWVFDMRAAIDVLREAEKGEPTEKMEEQEKQVSSIGDKEITDDISTRLWYKTYFQIAEYLGKQISLYDLVGKPF